MGSLISFGGVSVIAFGDLFQLKPVRDAWIFSSGYSTGNEYEILVPNLWQDLFSWFELTEIMRQKDDLRFAQLLNRLREGNQSPEDVKLLTEREIDYENNITLIISHLYTTRKKIVEFHTTVFEGAYMGRKTTVEAIDSIAGDLSSEIKEKI